MDITVIGIVCYTIISKYNISHWNIMVFVLYCRIHKKEIRLLQIVKLLSFVAYIEHKKKVYINNFIIFKLINFNAKATKN